MALFSTNPPTPPAGGSAGGGGTAAGSRFGGVSPLSSTPGATGAAGTTHTAPPPGAPPRPAPAPLGAPPRPAPAPLGGAPLPGAARPGAPLGGTGLSGSSGGIKVTTEEFAQLRDFIYEQCGIYIAETRKYLVENRLSNRLKELNLKNFGEYYYYLRFDANRRAELPKLFEVITTNETSFYRNPPQLQVFQETVLKQELEKLRKAGTRKLRIWSAGCSTGEEPYTMAMILHEVLKTEISSWDIKITANDLSEAVLASARRGVYSEYALRTTPREIAERYFKKEGTQYHVDSRLKNLISFGQINLSDRMLLRRIERSHIVFCRNVIIYFDDEMKKQVIESFYDNLLPGGCLFIGHSESLHNISRAFKPEHHTGTIVYRKQA